MTRISSEVQSIYLSGISPVITALVKVAVNFDNLVSVYTELHCLTFPEFLDMQINHVK